MTNNTFNNVPSTYIELVTIFPPRSIKSKAEVRNVQKVMDTLLNKETELSQDEQDYLDVLILLVEDYERHEIESTIPDIYGVEALKALIREHGLRQKDLVHVFKTESIVSAILNGQRKLTVEHIQRLADHFTISPSVFFPLKAQLASEV